MKIDSVDHLKTSIPTENFSIGAIFGPKTACEVKRLSKMMKILQILSKCQVFDDKVYGDPLYHFGRIQQPEVNICGASNIHFGPSYKYFKMYPAVLMIEFAWAEVTVVNRTIKS